MRPALWPPPEPPVRIGRDEAQREAARELLKAGYQRESAAERLMRWVSQLLDELFGAAGPSGGSFSLIVIAVVLATLAALLLWALRRTSRARRGEAGTVFDRRERTATEHRAAAERLAAAGDWAAAIQERLRAIARGLEERAIVRPLPGRTATELAEDAGRALPSHATALRAAAAIFNDVSYGRAAGTRQGYLTLAGLDEGLRAARASVEASA